MSCDTVLGTHNYEENKRNVVGRDGSGVSESVFIFCQAFVADNEMTLTVDCLSAERCDTLRHRARRTESSESSTIVYTRARSEL